jgi:putative transposase
MVDSLGYPIAIFVSAANAHDGQTGLELLWRIAKMPDNAFAKILADAAYKGEFVTYAQYYNFDVEISQKPETQQGFVPQTGHWQVERSFAWLNFFRRLSKDYEKTVAASVAFIQLAFISIILAKL